MSVRTRVSRRPRALGWRGLGWLAFFAALASCEGPCTADLNICDPDCQHWEVCHPDEGACRPRPCRSAVDCGSATHYACKPSPSSPDDTAKLFCQPLTCRHDSDCEDGLFCTPQRERCSPVDSLADGRGCSPLAFSDAETCAEGERCREDLDSCEKVCPVPQDEDGDGADSEACGGSDCDDRDPNRFFGNVEICDFAGHDEDCDPQTLGSRDSDGDGYDDSACCNTFAGVRRCASDCDDTRASVHPTATEVCNGRDDDCDGDSDSEVQIQAYPDYDRDGYGTTDGGTSRVCDYALGDGFSLYDNDCDDTNAALTPGTFRCTGGQNPALVTLCQSDGGWVQVQCASGLICVPQPTGNGICR